MKKAIMYLGLIAIFLLTACGNKQGNEPGQNETLKEESGAVSSENSRDEGGGQANPGDDIYGGVPMEELRGAVLEIIGANYWPNDMVAETDFQEKYGLTQEMYEDFFAEESVVESSADALVIVKAAPGRVEEIEKKLNEYREKLVDKTDTTPENGIKHNASRIEAFGSYVCFVQLGADLTTFMEQGEETVMTHCQEENEKALDAIRTTLLK